MLDIILICCSCFVCVLATSVIALVVYTFVSYNKLKELNFQAEQSWNKIISQLKKKLDLMFSVAEITVTHASNDDRVFTKINELKSTIISAEDPKELLRVEVELKSALEYLHKISEFDDRYEKLKSDEKFLSLRSNLQQVESNIKTLVEGYNDTVSNHNKLLVMFPLNYIAKQFNISKRKFFEFNNEKEDQAFI